MSPLFFLLLLPAVVMWVAWGLPKRSALRLYGALVRRPSIAKVLARSLCSPLVGQDWIVRSIHNNKRIEGENDKLGVSVWCYTFSGETHVFEGREELHLRAWEKAVLQHALMKRGRLAQASVAEKIKAANDERLAEIAQRVVTSYGSPLERSETMQ